MDPIESQYYNPSTDTKVGRTVRDAICAFCYKAENLLSVDYLINSCPEVGGKIPLAIFKCCLDNFI